MIISVVCLSCRSQIAIHFEVAVRFLGLMETARQLSINRLDYQLANDQIDNAKTADIPKMEDPLHDI